MTDAPLHSPLPWQFVEDDICDQMGYIEDARLEGGIFDWHGRGVRAHKEDAGLIVEAVNSHAQLKERVKILEKFLDEVVIHEKETRSLGAEKRSNIFQMFAGLASVVLLEQEGE